MIPRLQVSLVSPDIDIDVFRKRASVIGPLSPPLMVPVSKDDHALSVSSRLASGKPRHDLASADGPQIQEIARLSGVQIFDITFLPFADWFKHDRLILFAARYSAAAHKDGSAGDVRQAGVFLLDATGRILSAPFEETARIISGSQ